MTVVNQQALADTIPATVLRLCEKLSQAGYGVWCVGGAIRDAILMQLEPNRHTLTGDWDIASSAPPQKVTELFRRVVPSGIKHGTVTVILRDRTVEVTTLRGERGYSDGRRPDNVVFVNDIREDLARRDFTINAIAFDPLTRTVIDPFGGVGDLARKCLRAVGDPGQRFAEDGLRVLRAARFVATLEVELEPKTREAMAPSLESYRKVSAERIRDEWSKALKAQTPSRAFELMLEQGILNISAPELVQLRGCQQNRHHRFDVWTHTMKTLDQVARSSLPLRLAALLHDIGKPPMRALDPETGDFTFHDHEVSGVQISDTILRRLKFPNDLREQVLALVRNHLVVYTPAWTDAAVRRWLNRVTPKLSNDVLQLARADVMAKGVDASAQLAGIEALEVRVKQITAANQALAIKDLAIDGRQLLEALGMSPGPLVGRMLRSLFEEVLEAPERNERERLLERARELLKSFSDPAVAQTPAPRDN